jgi:hypothetical protein
VNHTPAIKMDKGDCKQIGGEELAAAQQPFEYNCCAYQVEETLRL